MVEVPADDTVEFALPVLAAFDCGPSQVVCHISVQPLLSKRCKEGGEERSGETRIEDGLDLNDHLWGTGPLWEGRNIISEGCIVCLVDQDTEEGSSLVVGVGAKFRLDVDDECGGDGGEQTSLHPRQHVYTGVSYRTHEDEGRVQIFIVLLYELLVVFISFLAVGLVEFALGVLLSGEIFLFPVALWP